MMKYPGLTDREAAASRARYGSNSIPDSEPVTFLQEFKETFRDPMIRILLMVAGIMTVMFFWGYSEIYEPAGTAVTVLIVAFVTAKTNTASDVKYRELKVRAEREVCKVYRNGMLSVIDTDDVVVGDLVVLQSGDRVPADGILTDGGLTVDNSALNGETEACEKTAVHTVVEFPEEVTGDTLTDGFSLFRGSVVLDGEGILSVRRVGTQTLAGKTAVEMQEAEPDSPLKVKLNRLAEQISLFGYVGAAGITFLYILFLVLSAGGLEAYLSTGWPSVLHDAVEAVSLAVVIVVCAVPEGLPLMISLVLMQNTGKMLDHNVLVRRAEGIETAGSLNILFSDKTGTITKGELEVVEFFTAQGETILPEDLRRHGKLKSFVDAAAGRNSAAMFARGHRIVGGNATDQALLRFIGEETCRMMEENETYRISASQNFNSGNKFSQAEIGALGMTFYKGAPEKLLRTAEQALDADGKEVKLDRTRLNRKIDEEAGRAMRILAFGYSRQKMREDHINEDIVIIGFAAIRDDVRPEAKAAIREVREAGIQVIMITGDRLETAEAIAREAGLLSSDGDLALTSSQLNGMSDGEIKNAMSRIRVIARALPSDKTRMVRLCQEMNLVTGMTGDGVNDSPALKRADVGFAMGSGTEAAKEAAKIVILDDNFRSVKDAVWYGRTIYHNILKFCRFQLAVNAAAVAVSAVAPFFGISEPLKVTHLLFVNLVMDGLGALMLGNEPAKESYMKEMPRKRDERIAGRSMMTQVLFAGGWITAVSFVFLKHPYFRNLFENEDQHLTAYFVFFILSALFNGFNVRDEGYSIFSGLGENRPFLKIFFLIVLVQSAIVNAAMVPLDTFGVISRMFGCVPFGIDGWIAAVLLAASIVPADLLRKRISSGSPERLNNAGQMFPKSPGKASKRDAEIL